jgi:hypothetical protein
MAMPATTLTTGDIAIELLADICVTMEVIDQSITARAMEVIKHPEQGPALRQMVQQLLAMVEAGWAAAPDGDQTKDPQPMSDGGS